MRGFQLFLSFGNTSQRCLCPACDWSCFIVLLGDRAAIKVIIHKALCNDFAGRVGLACAKVGYLMVVDLSGFYSGGASWNRTLFASLEAEANLIFDPRLHIFDLDGLLCRLNSLGCNLDHGCRASQD